MEAPLALAFCLSSAPDGALARLSDLRRATLPAAKPHDRLGGLYVSAGLALLEHAVAGKPETIPLEIEAHWGRDRLLTDRTPERAPEPVWCIDLEPV
jgi:hypothetical protein